MIKDYSQYLEKLKRRRYDEVLKEPVFSDNYHQSELPNVLKYAMEAMHEIDPSYSYKLYSAIRRTQEMISERLAKREVPVDARYVGPHATDTHINLYGDIEMLFILKSYDRKPSKSIQHLVADILDILTKAEAYDRVDYSSKNRIYIETRKPKCLVSILPAIWIESSLYKEASLEINKGICEYNFAKKTRRMYLPFLNIARINSTDRKIGGSIKHLIRLIRSIQVDAAEDIELSHDEIAGIVYNMSHKELSVDTSHYLSVLPNISMHLKRLIEDSKYRESLLSPSKKEYVFGRKQRVQAMNLLRKELDEFIQDINEALKPMNKTIASPIEADLKK
ncbi:MAG: hypothetical protein JXQ90_08125 [Cyclobacteriaceae bacterium]